MVSNSLRDAPPSIWPALRRLDGDGKLVYLDQKHWVHLAQADTGHPDGTCYAAALQAARAARAAGTAFFPLSMVHYSETLKITSVRHRSDLARLMEELSGFTALPARRLTALYDSTRRSRRPPEPRPAPCRRSICWATATAGRKASAPPAGS